MHVYFVVRHLELTDKLRAYAEHHLIQPIASHNRLVMTRVEVQLCHEGDQDNPFGCHVLVEVKGHHVINVRETQADIFSAIDLAKDRVLRRLTEVRHRMLTLRRHPKKYSFDKLARALGWRRGEI